MGAPAGDIKLTFAEARCQLSGGDILPMSADEAVEGEGGGTAAEVAGIAQNLREEVLSHVFDEGTVGLGIDIVEIERMANILTRRPAFAEQVFSEDECAYCQGKANPVTHFALRFAAKEAVVKALGTGFSDGIWVRDVEVGRAKNGRPFAVLSGRAAEEARARGVREVALSLSYTHTDAVACALAVTEGAVAATEKRKDPKEELALQFKETRKLLDEL